VSVTTVTSKGQLTIPKEIRDALHLFAGDKVEVVITNTNEALLRPVTKRVDEVFGRLSKFRKSLPLSIEEMKAAVQENMKKKIC